MHSYGVHDVEKLLGLSRGVLRSLIAAGFVQPERGARNALRFSFRDLIVLRTARTLAAAKIPHRRIVRALRELRRRLPEEMPLSGLSIGAYADHVVVREGDQRWHAESGQYLLAFEGDPAQGALRVTESTPLATARDRAAQLHADTGSLEAQDAEQALQAYAQAIAADPARVDARINRGHLLHELGRWEEAERAYREALSITTGTRDERALLHYNLGALFDDAGRAGEAIGEYEAALRCDPQLADGHYNLALLYEEQGQARRALKHMAQYRRLTRG